MTIDAMNAAGPWELVTHDNPQIGAVVLVGLSESWSRVVYRAGIDKWELIEGQGGSLDYTPSHFAVLYDAPAI